MTQEDLIEILAERPFIPLRLHLSSGRTHVIRHPELAIVAENLVAIGLPRDEESNIAERITHCSLAGVIEVEPLNELSGNGTGVDTGNANV